MRRASMALDVAAVALFVGIGRASHHHGETVGGFASTVWPFAVGLGCGWLLAGRRAVSWRSGAVVSVTTVAVGMVLRVVSGQGTAAAFVAVALCFLGGVMVGGRCVMITANRRRHQSASPSRR